MLAHFTTRYTISQFKMLTQRYYSVITHVIVVPVPVGSVTKRHNFPNQYTKTPHVTCRTKLPVLQRFRRGPTNRDFTTLWFREKKRLVIHKWVVILSFVLPVTTRTTACLFSQIMPFNDKHNLTTWHSF